MGGKSKKEKASNTAIYWGLSNFVFIVVFMFFGGVEILSASNDFIKYGGVVFLVVIAVSSVFLSLYAIKNKII